MLRRAAAPVYLNIAPTANPGAYLPADIYIMIDGSTSMLCQPCLRRGKCAEALRNIDATNYTAQFAGCIENIYKGGYCQASTLPLASHSGSSSCPPSP